MASNQQPSTAAAPAQEYIVRVSKDSKKKESILKFNPANNMDFTKPGKITMERENNYKEFKQAYDVDTMPKFGAGSEFGREAREEARKKKYGMKTRIYEPNDQPWTLKVGSDSKTNRRFKGIKEGGVLENASYYIFTQCPDGAFEAYPVEEWSNFTPIARYKVLNSEEAEKEFEKREKNVNFFNIMVRKRMKGDEADDGTEVDEDGKKVKKKKSKDFVLTELDEWAILSNSDESDNSENSDGEKKPKKEKPKKKKPTKKKSKAKNNSDDEALEDSDDLDEGKEVDYMTSSDSEDDAMFKDSSKVSSEKYDEKGVVEEDGLRKLIDSDEEEEEEQNKEEEDKEEEEEAGKSKEGKTEGSDSESSSSSDSDSDVEKAEKDGTFASALFMAKAKSAKKNKSNESTPNSSRSGTPTVGDDDKGKKRKGAETDSPMAKKARVSTPTPGTSSTPSGGSSDGINDETVRRYLMRKPMTTKELLIKFKHTGLSKEQRVTTLAQILKRLNPDKKKIKDQLYLSLKKPE